MYLQPSKTHKQSSSVILIFELLYFYFEWVFKNIISSVQVRPICRPGRNQRHVYNGHKRVHALKYQSVVAPNGLIVNMFGPVGKLFFI